MKTSGKRRPINYNYKQNFMEQITQAVRDARPPDAAQYFHVVEVSAPVRNASSAGPVICFFYLFFKIFITEVTLDRRLLQLSISYIENPFHVLKTLYSFNNNAESLLFHCNFTG